MTLAQAARQPRDLARARAPGDTGQGRTDPYAGPEQQRMHPEPSKFGVVPDYGLYVRHAKGIRMDDVDVSFVDDDRRPAFVLDDVHDAEFHRASARKSSGVPTFVLRNVTEFRAVHSRPIPDTYVRSAKLKVF